MAASSSSPCFENPFPLQSLGCLFRVLSVPIRFLIDQFPSQCTTGCRRMGRNRAAICADSMRITCPLETKCRSPRSPAREISAMARLSMNRRRRQFGINCLCAPANYVRCVGRLFAREPAAGLLPSRVFRCVSLRSTVTKTHWLP